MKVLILGLSCLLGAADAPAWQVPRGTVLSQDVVQVAPSSPIGDGLRPSPSVDAELLTLVRAQTVAIRALSGRLESLEQRLERLEAGGAP